MSPGTVALEQGAHSPHHREPSGSRAARWGDSEPQTKCGEGDTEHAGKGNCSDLYYARAGHRAAETASALPCRVTGSPQRQTCLKRSTTLTNFYISFKLRRNPRGNSTGRWSGEERDRKMAPVSRKGIVLNNTHPSPKAWAAEKPATQVTSSREACSLLTAPRVGQTSASLPHFREGLLPWG